MKPITSGRMMDVSAELLILNIPAGVVLFRVFSKYLLSDFGTGRVRVVYRAMYLAKGRMQTVGWV